MRTASSHKFTGADRYTGISATQAAQAAAWNITRSNVAPSRILGWTVRLVQAFDEKKKETIWNEIRVEARKRLVTSFATGHYSPPIAIDVTTLDHHRYVEGLLSPRGLSVISDPLASELLGMTGCDHADALDRLRATSPFLHRLLVQYDIAAIACAIGSGEAVIDDLAEFTRIVATHVKCFAIRTAHDLVASIGYAAKAPYGAAFSGFHSWKYTGHVVLSTIAAPASVIRRTASAQDSASYRNVSDSQAIAQAVADHILPHVEAGMIVELAQQARDTLWHSDQLIGLTAIRDTLYHLADNITLAAGLNRGQMRLDGFERLDPIERQTGLEASEAASFDADELVKACAWIDLAVPGALAGRKLPSRKVPQASIKTAGYIAALLRAESGCDMRAAPVRFDHQGNPVDFERAAFKGRPPLRRARQKARKPGARKRIEKLLRIDPRHWF